MEANRPLPPGTIIEFRGGKAEVVEDAGVEILKAFYKGKLDDWYWKLGPKVSTVVSLPSKPIPIASLEGLTVEHFITLRDALEHAARFALIPGYAVLTKWIDGIIEEMEE